MANGKGKQTQTPEATEATETPPVPPVAGSNVADLDVSKPVQGGANTATAQATVQPTQQTARATQTAQRTEPPETVMHDIGGGQMVPANQSAAPSPGAAAFDGIDNIGDYMPYCILDGTEILNKASNVTYRTLQVIIEGGRPVWQLWDQNSVLIAESFDGINSTDGRLMAEALQSLKETQSPADAEKTKVQARYEIYFPMDYGADGIQTTKISLSPMSKAVFGNYNKILKRFGLGPQHVVTTLYAKRTQNANNQRYSLIQMYPETLADGGPLPAGLIENFASAIEAAPGN